MGTNYPQKLYNPDMKPITAGMIPKDRYEQFRQLYLTKYGVLLTGEQTVRFTLDLINLMRVLTKPWPEEKNK